MSLLYSFGWLLLFYGFFLSRKEHLRSHLFGDRIFLLILFSVPLGKLIYFPVPGLIGFKFCFLFWVVFSLFVSVARLFSSFKKRYLYLLLIFLSMPIFSFFIRGSFDGLLVYMKDGQNDSLLARLFVLGFLVGFMCYLHSFIKRNGAKIAVRFFLHGIFCSSLVGLYIFYFVYSGKLGVPDLLPISSDTHIIGNIYRFNPGANVNEFGMMSAFGLFLFPLLEERSKFKRSFFYGLMFFGLFFSLTRSAWLGYVFALLFLSFFNKVARTRVAILFVFSFVTVFTVYNLSPQFAEIVTSRFALQAGPSGNDRLNKAKASFKEEESHVTETLFGHGWATNLYIHSLPLQLIYEVGLVGFLLFYSWFGYLIFRMVKYRSRYPPIVFQGLIGSSLVLIVSSTFQHTVYLMETWVIFGFLFASLHFVNVRKEIVAPARRIVLL